MSLRHRIGALLYDWPRYRRAMRGGRWALMHNRNERVSTDGRGVRCEWRFTSDLHIAKVFPTLGANRSEEHTSELQSQSNLVCRLLLEKKKKKIKKQYNITKVVIRLCHECAH